MSQHAKNSEIIWKEIVAQTVSDVGILDETRESEVLEAFSQVPAASILGPIDQDSFVNAPHELGYGLRCYPLSLLIRFLSLVEIKRRSRVLCVGCGSGYLSAVVSTIGAQTFGIESVGPLIQQTRKNLDAAGYSNVVIHRGDPYKGWPEQAPFDVIFIERAFDELPQDFVEQLTPLGGMLVAVVRDDGIWRLVQCERDSGEAKWTKFEIIEVSAVGKI